MDDADVAQAISQLTGLQELGFCGMPDLIPEELGALYSLQRLRIGDIDKAAIHFPGAMLRCTQLTFLKVNRLTEATCSQWQHFCRSFGGHVIAQMPCAARCMLQKR